MSRIENDAGTLRVSLVTETFPPEINGVSRTLSELVRSLARRGHRVEVLRPRRDAGHEAPAGESWQEILVPGAPLPRYPQLRFGLPCGRRLRRHWRQQRPDIVHIATEGPLGLSALRAARQLEIPVTSSFHTNFHTYGSYYGYGPLQRPVVSYLRFFHNRTQRTLVPGGDAQRFLSESGFERLTTLDRGVDTDHFSHVHRCAVLRQRWGAGPEDPVIAYVGRLATEKNLDLAMRTFEEVREHCPRARFVLVGDGPAEKRLRRRDGRIFFRGMRHGGDLATHYASADILLFPSLTETFGNVVLEGMASGLAVVAFHRAAARLHIEPEVNGITVPEGRDDLFVHGALRLARDLTLRRCLGEAARETALGLSWETIGDTFEQVLRDAARPTLPTTVAPTWAVRDPTVP